MKQLFGYEEEAGRIELFIRIIYSFIIGIILSIYGFIAGICLIIQFFVIFILGRRSQGLSGFIRGYLEYYVHILPYTSFMTDERPGIFPKTVGIFEEEA
ncbi:MAG: DUF4389 domain-containing protein [Methanospirillum sp.]|uniref:DUF4389 domain-containing protein n=1 Tax=Methanospirillum sp. TaxID=45200 RepID=UPI00236D2FE0|nr:DUF4389 domain-containing protein [Methanospirillum sp.]MDD1730313.1 DUF4389 domain-containing protein [Methanospirillum sp.]